MSVLSRNELLHKYEKEIREIDEINKNDKFKHISELNRRLLWNVEEEFVTRDKMVDSLNIEFEDVLKNNIRMVGELERKFERYKWLKRNLNDLWERIERVDEYNITNKKKLFGFFNIGIIGNPYFNFQLFVKYTEKIWKLRNLT